MYRLSHILCLLFTSSPLWAWQQAPLSIKTTMILRHQQQRHHDAGAFTWRLEAARMYNSEMSNGQYYDGMDEYGRGRGNYYDSMEYGDYNGGGGGGFYNDRRGGGRSNGFNNNRPSTSSGSDDHETLGPVRKSRASSFWNTPSDNRRNGSHETLGPQPYFESTARKNRAQSFWTTGSELREQAQRNQPYSPRRPVSRYDNMNPGGGGGFQQDFGPRRNDFRGGGYNSGSQRLYNGGGGGVGYNTNDRRGNNNWSPLPPNYQNNNFDPMEYDMYGGPGGYNDPRGGAFNEDYNMRWNPRSRGGPQRYPMTTKRSQYQSGVTSPISSEKFQDSIGSHTSMGPMPAWERRKMEKKWREEDYDDYYW